MTVRSLLAYGVCAVALAACTDYVLPERVAPEEQVTQNSEFPERVDDLNDLNALIVERNRQRVASGQRPLTQEEVAAQINRERALQEQGMSAFMAASVVEAAVGSSTAGPTNPVPGQCYAQALRPAQFATVSEQVVDTPATERFEVVPPTFRDETAPVVVEEAYTKVEVVPAVYQTVMETVVVEPERTETVTIPAEYQRVLEQVPVRPSFRAWRACGQVFPVGSPALGGTFLGNRTDGTGRLECLIEFPATFETVEREELVSPERTEVVTIPAVTREVPRRVVVQPARSREVTVPARIENVTRRVVATEERVERVEVPATFRTVERRTQEVPAALVWTNVVCDTNRTKTFTASVQRGLKARGFYGGAIDGIEGRGTRSAVRAFQLENGLDSDVLTVEAAQELGAL
ncbi:MAG: peptidoglycan-binding protein [Pseudomonadota bacterium]